jgi:hypothetical protein
MRYASEIEPGETVVHKSDLLIKLKYADDEHGYAFWNLAKPFAIWFLLPNEQVH